MKYKINSPMLWQLSVIIIICMLITCAAGCKNGKRLNTNSSGIIRVITPNDLIKQPDGTFKLKPRSEAKIPDGIPYNPPIFDIKVTSMPAVRSSPKPTKTEPAKANPTPHNPKAAGETKPFTPTVSQTAKNEKLHPPKPVRPNNKLPLKEPPIKVSMNVKPEGWCGTKDPDPAEGEGASAGSDEKSSIKVDWMSLGFFYFLVFLVGLGIWTVCDIYKEYKSKKKSS